MISLEPMRYAPSDKDGNQYTCNEALTIGDWVYTSGTTAINGITYKKVRKATTGLYSAKTSESTPITGVASVNRLGVVFREPQAYREEDEMSDTDWNALSIASKVIIFWGGTFRTSRFNTGNIDATTPPGSLLWVDMDGLLDIGASVQQKRDKPVARLDAYNEAGTTDYIEYTMI